MPARHKPWIKVDADADESDKVARLPNHSARWGWFRMMCRAKTQRRLGVFAGEAHLRQLLGTEGRYVPAMVEAGLLHIWPADCGRCSGDYAEDATAGELVVHDFRREQRDPTNAERQSRHRNSESNANLTVDSRALSPSLSMSPSETQPRDGYQVPGVDEDDEYPVLAWMAEHGAAVPDNGNGFHRRIVVMVGRYGAERVRRAMAEAMTAGARGDRAIVFGAENLLDPVPTGKPKPEVIGKGGVSAEDAERAFGIVR